MPHSIAIIGGGASGALALLKILAAYRDQVSIDIFEPAPQLGIGKAYAPGAPEYLLNVPCSRMGWRSADDGSFEVWCKSQPPTLETDRFWPFVPREWWGNYITETLNAALPKGRVTHLREEVTGVSPQSGRWSVSTSSQSRSYDSAVIATGYTSRAQPLFPEAIPADLALNENPQASERGSGERLLIIGTGLTALDLFRKFRSHAKHITFLSRHGLFPLPHLPGHHRPRWVFDYSFSNRSPQELCTLLSSLRKQDPSLEAVREAADRMRPELPSLWRSWDSKARAFFMRHLKAYWEVIRHRAPIPVLEDIASERAQGNVETLAGSIQSIEKKHGQYEVSFRRRRGTQIETLCVDRVFDATGAKIRRDFSGEHLRQDPFGFGYEKCSGEGIFLIGPPAKGIHWECTAVPEIRLQADEIVKQFKEKLA